MQGELNQKNATTEAELESEIEFLERELSAICSKYAELKDEVSASREKVVFADAMATYKRNMLIGEFANVLRHNGIVISTSELIEWMKENGFIARNSGLTTQKAIKMGVLDAIEHTHVRMSSHSTTKSITIEVTGVGQQYFINLFLKEKSE